MGIIRSLQRMLKCYFSVMFSIPLLKLTDFAQYKLLVLVRGYYLKNKDKLDKLYPTTWAAFGPKLVKHLEETHEQAKASIALLEKLQRDYIKFSKEIISTICIDHVVTRNKQRAKIAQLAFKVTVLQIQAAFRSLY